MCILFITLLLSAIAVARDAAPAADDPVLEARVNALASELRCLVCQNQTIADSSAGLAIDLKNQVREKMRLGESDAQIVEFMVQRYGDFVLYRPPVKVATILLWFGPLLLVLAGLFVLYRKLRVQASTEEPALTLQERERAASLLAPDNQGKAV
ncbi:MAG: cytochrome c-type biogenesis protein [Burkholderiales bacterium]